MTVTSSRVVRCPQCSTKNRVPDATHGTPRCANCKHDLPWLVDASDTDFDQIVDTSKLVLVDLWAAWCGPCRMVAPVLAKLSVEFAGRLKVVKVDVDRSPQLAQRYRAQSIPMLLFLQDGQVVRTVVGAQPEGTLRTMITSRLDAAGEPRA
ncbi:thioredoxin [Skermania piniformis]|uniref:Thioredoxin n=1 Tax=Skermania pinensis TaxID=39122 RepID=A0ABX8S7Q5_9ACTN|nr:thioredoxin [Skermania piniformis]